MKYSIKDFPRLERLRKTMLEADRAVCVERARYYTEYYTEVLPEEEKAEGRNIPPVLRQARAFRHIMTNRSVKIFPDELIVGSTTSKLLGGLIFPEFLHLAVWPELNTISKRKDNPFIIEQREIDELNDVIFPRWMETNVLQRAKEIWEGTEKSEVKVNPFNILEKFSFYLLSKANGISHIAPHYAKGIEQGFGYIIDEAEKKRQEARGKRETEDFYLAIKTIADGIIAFANRYSDEALRLSEKEKESKRKFELIKIADICKRIPARPARTFHEALQSLWFIQIALHQENYDMGISFGRGDQYLYPYYKRDVEIGILKEKDALELLGCFWVKSTDHVAFTPSTGSLFFGGTPSNQPMTIGGVDKNGKDATNELTYLMLEASAMLGVREPNLSARIHRDSPQEYLLKVAEAIKESHGTPAVYNDDYIIPIVKNTIRPSKSSPQHPEPVEGWGEGGGEGVMPIEDARDYAVIGCVEANVHGKTFGMTGAALVNMVSALDLALNDGYYPRRMEQVGPHTGDPRKFKSMDELREAYRIQIEFLIMNVVNGNNTLGKAHQELTPTPFLSSLIDGAMEKGMDVTMGSAVYNSSGVTGMGLSDVADSLTAIQYLVFEGIDLPPYGSKGGNNKVTMEEMLSAVEDDFKNNPVLHAIIINKAPKYGNNNPKADANAKFVADVFCKAVSQYDNYRGGKYNPGFWTMTTHVGWGKLGGALPNGRKANQYYASGVTPAGGMDREGPTSSLLSAANLTTEDITNIYAFNQRFGVITGNGSNNPSLPELVEGRGEGRGEGDIKKLSQLIRAYFNEGGLQVQFTVADAAMLRDAQKNPEKHRGLIVRISGYTAYFVDLNQDCQSEIIARTEHRIIE
ncbi:MAG: hypothetical protein HZA00_10790 [Nitrospinae bacterium]|nr:hypothetical protein [Nitrospinota bacterium]